MRIIVYKCFHCTILAQGKESFVSPPSILACATTLYSCYRLSKRFRASARSKQLHNNMGNQNSVPATNCAPQPKQQSDDAMLHNNHPAPKKDQEKIKAEVWAYALSEDVNKSNKRKDPPISSSRNLDTSSIYLNPHIKKGVRKKCRTTNNSLFHLGLQKKLLQAIEDCGGLKRNDKAWLRTLCEANCDIYGPSKSKLRASVYNKVFKWKQLSREEYLELLDECGVTPGKPAGDTQKQEPRRVLPIGPTPPPDDDVPQSATIAAAAKPTHLVPAHLQQLAHSTCKLTNLAPAL